MRKLLNVFCLILISSGLFAQLEEKIKKENVVPGIVIKDGKEVKGFIKRMGNAYEDGKHYPAPWQFQTEIKFIPEDKFIELEKVKNKHFEEYKSNDIDAYVYDTLRFESVKYSDLSSVGVSMLARRMFMRKISDGKIALYHYHSNPPPVASGGFAQYYIECGVPKWVYRKGDDEKLKAVEGMNISKELADCSLVVEKHERGEYKVLGKEGEGSKTNKFINNFYFTEKVRLLAIADYNQNCD
ncbi:MAG: hypothetical protein R2769_17530 [Saprospiraceae bacterium]